MTSLSNGSDGPDFSDITSVEAAEALVQQGHLTRLLLLPEVFGGSDIPHNIVYVPPFVVEFKASIDHNIILPLAQDGMISQYEAKPEYAGNSFIPVALHVTAFNPGNFSTVIRIWGEG
jgi:hypothetical protein